MPKFNAAPLIVTGLVGVGAVAGWWLWNRNRAQAGAVPPTLYDSYLAQLLAATTESELSSILVAFRADWDTDLLSYDEYIYLNHAWSYQLFIIRGEPDTSMWSVLKDGTPLSVADGGMTKSDMTASGLWPS